MKDINRQRMRAYAEELFDSISDEEKEDVLFRAQTVKRLRRVLSEDAEKEADRRVEAMRV